MYGKKSILHLLFISTAGPGSVKFMIELNKLKPKYFYDYLPQVSKSYNFYNFSMSRKFYIAQHWSPNISSQNNATIILFFSDIRVILLAHERYTEVFCLNFSFSHFFLLFPSIHDPWITHHVSYSDLGLRGPGNIFFIIPSNLAHSMILWKFQYIWYWSFALFLSFLWFGFVLMKVFSRLHVQL